MKKTAGILVLLIMVLMFAACGGEGTETNYQSRSEMAESGKTEDPDIDYHPVYGQDPFAIIPGKYTAIGQKANAVVTSPAIDTLQIVITESGDAGSFVEWTLTGKLDDSLSLTFQDSVSKLLTCNQNGDIIKEETQYTNGSGTVVFDNDSVKFTWNDVKSGEGAVAFVLNQDEAN